MKWLIIFIGCFMFCTANKTDVKEKRQIEHTRIPTTNLNSPHHQQRQFSSGPQRQYILRTSAGSPDQQSQEIPPEYLNLLQELAIQQQQTEQTQQQEIKKQYRPTNSVPRLVQQYPIPSERPQFVLSSQKGQPEPQVLSESEYYQLIQSQNQLARPQFIRQPAQQTPTISPKYGFKAEQSQPQPQNIHSIQSQSPQQQHQQQQQQQQHQQQQQYASTLENIQEQQIQYIPISQLNKSQYPLAESSLEKEIAKLVASNTAVGSYQNNQKQKNFKQQNLHYKPQPSVPFASPQQQIQYIYPGSHTEESRRPFSSPLVSPHYNEESSAPIKSQEDPNKGQYLSEVSHRFSSPQPIHHQQQQQQQQQPQYSVTVPNHHQQPQYSYDRSNIMKIVPAPQLQYEGPKNPQQAHLYQQQNQPQQQHSQPQQLHEKPIEEQQSQFPQELFQKVLQNPNIAGPSRSAIYFSQTTGAPPTKQDKPNQQIKLPPPNGGRPLTQEEFQALVDAGYSVTAVPVPVPVPADEYHSKQRIQYLQQQQQQQQQLLGQQTHQHNKRTSPKPYHFQQTQDESSLNYAREQYNTRNSRP